MRSPPPIPTLRPTLVCSVHGDRAEVRDRRTGRVSSLGQGPWPEFFALLCTPNTPSQAELASTLGLPRFAAQAMTERALALHLFATPRAAEQVRILSDARHLRRSSPATCLSATEVISPRARRALFAAMIRLGRAQGGSGREVLGWIEALSAFVDRREARFAEDEVFASRDAFHVVRPDPTEAPEHFRAELQRLARAAEALGSPLRDGLISALTGGSSVAQGEETLGRDPAAPCFFSHALRATTRRPASGGLISALSRAHLITCASRHRAGPDREDLLRSWAQPASRAWLRRHDTLITSLFFIQAGVFHGQRAPRSAPAWWTRLAEALGNRVAIRTR